MLWMINFGELRLEAEFSGTGFYTAEVKFSLRTIDGRTIEQSHTIPVKSLFDMSYVMDLAIRKYTAELENTLQSIKKEKENGKED